MSKKRVVVPVLCSSSLQYRSIYRHGILKTFASKSYESPKVIPYFGSISTVNSTIVDTIHTTLAVARISRISRILRFLNTNSAPVSGERIVSEKNVDIAVTSLDEISLRFDIPETTGNVAHRFLEVLKWILLNEQVDFIWHSNISTYLNLDRMQYCLNDVSSSLYYAGVIGEYDDFTFVSGASVCLGRDTAELIISHRNEWDFSLPWDVALGKLLHSLSVLPTFIDRVDLKDERDVFCLSDDQLYMSINFRCKACTWKRRDHKIMKLLHSRINALN